MPCLCDGLLMRPPANAAWALSGNETPGSSPTNVSSAPTAPVPVPGLPLSASTSCRSVVPLWPPSARGDASRVEELVTINCSQKLHEDLSQFEANSRRLIFHSEYTRKQLDHVLASKYGIWDWFGCRSSSWDGQLFEHSMSLSLDYLNPRPKHFPSIRQMCVESTKYQELSGRLDMRTFRWYDSLATIEVHLLPLQVDLMLPFAVLGGLGRLTFGGFGRV